MVSHHFFKVAYDNNSFQMHLFFFYLARGSGLKHLLFANCHVGKFKLQNPLYHEIIRV